MAGNSNSGRTTRSYQEKLAEKQAIARDAIDSELITKKLISHILGKSKMTRDQISAAKILLDRVLPVMQAAEITQETTIQNVVAAKPLTNEEWAEQYARQVGDKPVESEVNGGHKEPVH